MAASLAEAASRTGQHDLDAGTAVDEMPGCHQPAAAVVTGADRDHEATVSQVTANLGGGHARKVRAGLLHHLGQRDAVDIDREAVHLGHLVGTDRGDSVRGDAGDVVTQVMGRVEGQGEALCEVPEERSIVEVRCRGLSRPR